MEALKKKLKSRRGASILLALLFLLLCIMVGASLVMAAASNAGKIKSNKVEQQKYLTLSSAMTLLVDELESVEYVGQYDYKWEWCPVEIKDGEGNVIGYEHNKHHTYTLRKGKMQLRDGAKIKKNDWEEVPEEKKLNDVLPLRDDLDKIFAKRFPVGTQTGQISGDLYNYGLNLGTGVTANTDALAPCEYNLELEVDDFDTVRIEVKIEDLNEGIIVLTATLMEPEKKDDETIEWKETDYTMKAVLTPNVRPDSLDVNWYIAESSVNNRPTEEHVNWTLDFIFKEATTP